jgi:hypothetical protein
VDAGANPGILNATTTLDGVPILSERFVEDANQLHLLRELKVVARKESEANFVD